MYQYLVSTGSLPKSLNKEFYEYAYIPEALLMLEADGIELVFLPEWNSDYPPLTQSSADWLKTCKITVNELVEYIHADKINVPSVHINRDVGTLLCSNDQKDIKRGQEILLDNLQGGCQLGSQIAVLHLWDTYKTNLDIKHLFIKVEEISRAYPINISYENIPMSDKSKSQATIWEMLKEVMPYNHGFTLDLTWCSLYNNFNELKGFIKNINNIHVQGYMEGNNLRPKVGDLNILECLREICLSGYEGFITVELNNIKDINDYKIALQLIKQSSNLKHS